MRTASRTAGTGTNHSLHSFELNRNRLPIPRGLTASNRLGRSSDLLPFRSLPDPERISGRDVRNERGASQQRDCPGFAPDSLFTPPPDGGRRPNLPQRYGLIPKNKAFSQIIETSGIPPAPHTGLRRTLRTALFRPVPMRSGTFRCVPGPCRRGSGAVGRIARQRIGPMLSADAEASPGRIADDRTPPDPRPFSVTPAHDLSPRDGLRHSIARAMKAVRRTLPEAARSSARNPMPPANADQRQCRSADTGPSAKPSRRRRTAKPGSQRPRGDISRIVQPRRRKKSRTPVFLLRTAGGRPRPPIRLPASHGPQRTADTERPAQDNGPNQPPTNFFRKRFGFRRNTLLLQRFR